MPAIRAASLTLPYSVKRRRVSRSCSSVSGFWGIVCAPISDLKAEDQRSKFFGEYCVVRADPHVVRQNGDYLWQSLGSIQLGLFTHGRAASGASIFGVPITGAGLAHPATSNEPLSAVAISFTFLNDIAVSPLCQIAQGSLFTVKRRLTLSL